MSIGMIIALIKKLGVTPDPSVIESAVDDYLEEHPEATCPIDDTAGEGDTGKVWSADKTAGEVATLTEAIGNKVPTALMKKCQLVDYHSANWWDGENCETGYVAPSTGTVYTTGNYANYRYSDKIPVTSGDTLYFYQTGVGKSQTSTITCYNSSEEVMGSSGASSSAQSFEIPEGVAYVVLTITASRNSYFMALKNISTMPGQFIPCTTDQFYAATADFIPDGTITADKTDFVNAGSIVLNIPSKIYATEGIECNIYFENITEDWTQFKWNVDCDVGNQLERGFRFTPESTDAGTHTLSITAENAYGSKKTVTASLIVTDAEAGDGDSASVIVLGDSTTAGGTAVTKLNANFADDPMTIATLGTKGTSPNNHEGRSGWNFNKYFNESEGNAFYNPTSQTFDASYYFTNSGVSVPDWFFINLGINDMFTHTTDVAMNSKIAEVIGKCDDMIASIQSADNSIKIGLCLTIPPNHSQDAFGKEYNCGQTRHRYKRNNTMLVKAFIEEYDGREAEGIYLVPIHVALDVTYNMGMESTAVNARNTGKTYDSPVANGAVHPAESGYWQIADMYTAFLKAQAE